MAVSGLLALLDDVSSMLDDPSNLEQLAAEKTAKIAEDDITAGLHKGKKLDANHEISVILAVAKGALKNKLLYFIPLTFATAVFAPWAVAPLSIGSGAFIAYEGVKKFAAKRDAAAAKHSEGLRQARAGGKETLLRYEKERIAQAIKTDAALSLELTGFQLGMVAGAPILTKLAVVGVASVGATMLLYASIIGIIGMNGVARGLAATPGTGWAAKSRRAAGRQMAKLSSPVMKSIAVAGMAALFYVGGHLLTAYLPGAGHAIAAFAGAVTTSPLGAAVLEIAATMATGLAAGVAAFGSVNVLAEPLRRLKISAQWLWEEKLKAPVAGFKARLVSRFGAAPAPEPRRETATPPAVLSPVALVQPVPMPPTVTDVLSPPGAVARAFTWAAAPDLQPRQEAAVCNMPPRKQPQAVPKPPS